MTVRVWDGFIRGFHWLLLVVFAGLWFTGGEMDFDYIKWHKMLGVFLIALIITRIIWGVVGSESARFRYFLAGPKALFLYLRNPRSFTAHTHNPMGGWSAVLMLFLLLVQGVTGLFSDDAIMNSGPLAATVSSDVSKTMTSLHHLNFDLLQVIIGLHLLAIIVYKFVGQPLVYAMVKGNKKGDSTTQPHMVNGAWGYVILAVTYGLLNVFLG
ncbi:MAG TPA: cytochrome b/b6 domain-containing protein [Aliidiomarina sp.]|nr:cytochrome b/b6 domain-containing protein [Aliidiomarina sp.]